MYHISFLKLFTVMSNCCQINVKKTAINVTSLKDLQDEESAPVAKCLCVWPVDLVYYVCSRRQGVKDFSHRYLIYIRQQCNLE